MRMRIGFTLIELLVCVAIIVVLMALLLPALGRARESARTSVCLSNQRQCGMSLQMYAGDYQSVVALLAYPPSTLGNRYAGIPWMNYVTGIDYNGLIGAGNYMTPTTSAQHCPKNGRKGTGAWWGAPRIKEGSYAALTQINTAPDSFGTITREWKTDTAGETTGMFYGLSLIRVVSPANYIILIDSAVQDGTFLPLKNPDPVGAYSISPQGTGHPTGGGQSASTWLAHPGDCANVLFSDFHAETCNRNQLRNVANYNNDTTWAPNNRGLSRWWDNNGLPLH